MEVLGAGRRRSGEGRRELGPAEAGAGTRELGGAPEAGGGGLGRDRSRKEEVWGGEERRSREEEAGRCWERPGRPRHASERGQINGLRGDRSRVYEEV